MKKILILTSLLSVATAFAQIDNKYQNEDDRQRGYYDRPWQRYEAENGKCVTNGTVLSASFANTDLQSEATNQVATNLTKNGDYVRWTCGKTANALTLRFSLPDSQDGKGTQGNIGLYVDGKKVKVIQSGEERDNILLDSYWAWQYFSGGENVAYNTPRESILRMRFDEVIVRLNENIPEGKTFELRREDNNANAYTIDFVELEMAKEVTFESLSGNKAKFDGDNLQDFINQNQGKTIYIPAGKYDVDVRLRIPANTTIQGAGIFFTEIYFSNSLNSGNYKERGFESYENNVHLKDMHINTKLNERYKNRNDWEQPGKGLNGTFGSNSSASNLLIQHFECGAWIADHESGRSTQNFTFSHCRIRNNYADGINFCMFSKSSKAEHCSFRNNGDDDMASWSADNNTRTEKITYQYNTSECNWRASGIGFFGGSGHTAQHCLVVDAIESALRIDATFPGKGFATDSWITFSDIAIYTAGTQGGATTVWMHDKKPAIDVTLEGAKYNIQNIKFTDIDIHDSRQYAIRLESGNYAMRNLCFENINIDNAKYGFRVESGISGNTNYSNIRFSNCTNELQNNSGGFKICYAACGETVCKDSDTPAEDDKNPNPDAIETVTENGFAVRTERGAVSVSGATPNTPVVLWNLLGQKVAQTSADTDGEAAVYGIPAGTYILMANNARTKIIVE